MRVKAAIVGDIEDGRKIPESDGTWEHSLAVVVGVCSEWASAKPKIIQSENEPFRRWKITECYALCTCANCRILTLGKAGRLVELSTVGGNQAPPQISFVVR